MKYCCFFLCCYFTLHFTATAQSKQKDTKAFLQQLNDIIKNSPGQHWGYEDTMTVDSAFAINQEGILSVTVRYTNDSVVTRVRTTAPVNKIERIAYDLYLILEFKDDLVTFYKTDASAGELKETGKGHLFHIGAPLPEDVKYQQKLQRALDKLLIHYPK